MVVAGLIALIRQPGGENAFTLACLLGLTVPIAVLVVAPVNANDVYFAAVIIVLNSYFQVWFAGRLVLGVRAFREGLRGES